MSSPSTRITIGSLTDRPALGRLIRRDERQRSVVGGESGEHFIISSPAERRFHAIETHIPPGGSAGEPPYTFPAESELVVCLSGTLELRVGETTYVLEEGDTFTYSPRDAHTWRNPSETALAIIAEVVAERYGGSGTPMKERALAAV